MQYDFLQQLEETLIERQGSADVNASYVAQLFAKGTDAIAKKIGEESAEVILAAKDSEHCAQHDGEIKHKVQAALVHESADLLFHLLVLLRQHGISFADVVAELHSRHATR